MAKSFHQKVSAMVVWQYGYNCYNSAFDDNLGRFYESG